MFSQQSVTSKPLETERRNRKENGAGYADTKINNPLAERVGKDGMQQTIERKSVEQESPEATQPIPIMEWWRLKPLASMSAYDLPRLKRCIRGFDIIGDPHWRAAEAGDVPAAIAVAVRLVKQGLIATPVMNLAGTALLIAAIKGDATARLMIEYLAGLKTEDCLKQEQNQPAATVHQLQRLIVAQMEACS
jgi:hypothetical protein